MARYTTQTYIEKARKVHGERYNYSLVKYSKSSEKIIIICKEHGPFEQEACSHLQGHGCPHCKGKTLRSNTEEFVRKSRLIYGDRFDYSKVEYVTNYIPVILHCNIHNIDFRAIPLHHLGKDSHASGCPGCAKDAITYNKLSNTEAFIKKANEVHNGLYDYSLVDYKRNDEKVTIVCKKHGPFEQTPANHLYGYGCNQCAIESNRQSQMLSQEEFLQRSIEVHGDRYDLSQTVYKGYEEPIIVNCKTHGPFLTTPHNFINAQSGCPKCNNPKLECIVESWLKENGIAYETQKKFPWLKSKRCLLLDFFLPEYNVAIECQGDQHFTFQFFSKERVDYIADTGERDKLKHDQCEAHGIPIIYFVNKDSTCIPERYLGPIVKDKIELLFEIFKHKK